MEPIYFAHLTDIHINAPAKNNPLFGIDTTAKLRKVFEDIRGLKTKPSFILISGDLTQDGDLEDYRHLKALIDEESAKAGIPVHVGLGNHDFRAPFREGYLEEAPSEESYYYSFVDRGLRIVMLNTQVPGTHDGRLDEVQLAWLEATLNEPAEQGSIVVLHHPVTATPTELMDSHLLQNPQDLAEAISGRGVIGLLSGHIHFHNIGSLNGIPSCAATGVAFGLDPTARHSMDFLDNSGYNLVTVKNGQIAVQPRYLPGEHRLVYEYDPQKLTAHK
ncbi:metallophosphoesterase [Paenibacillus sp. PDC88]|uniref:metallophosphoesterase family protein n=1 Tax=Paenibacillus TaxID=44249 RepID=UPI00089BE0D7|nr:metallophosphoesterase [Paenibacillus sp. PDC88]SDX28330.1 Calcineurin-like phosphoesterase [Paenibacillus sp. PDC88]